MSPRDKRAPRSAASRKTAHRAVEEAFSSTFMHVEQGGSSEELSSDAQGLREQFRVRTPADCPMNTATAFLAPRKLAIGVLKDNSHTKKKPEGHINRPPNAFILFRAAQSQNMLPSSATQQQRLSSLISAFWKSLTKAERATWFTLADDVKGFHAVLFPEYQFIPHPQSVTPAEKTRKTNLLAHQRLSPLDDARIDAEMQRLILKHTNGVPVDLEALEKNSRLFENPTKKSKTKRAPKGRATEPQQPIVEQYQFQSHHGYASDAFSPASSVFSVPLTMSPASEISLQPLADDVPPLSLDPSIRLPEVRFDPNYSLNPFAPPPVHVATHSAPGSPPSPFQVITPETHAVYRADGVAIASADLYPAHEYQAYNAMHGEVQPSESSQAYLGGAVLVGVPFQSAPSLQCYWNGPYGGHAAQVQSSNVLQFNTFSPSYSMDAHHPSSPVCYSPATQEPIAPLAQPTHPQWVREESWNNGQQHSIPYY